MEVSKMIKTISNGKLRNISGGFELVIIPANVQAAAIMREVDGTQTPRGMLEYTVGASPKVSVTFKSLS